MTECNSIQQNICFEASFASSDKVDFWSELNAITPREVFKSCGKKFWFNCPKSNHEFESSLNNIHITNGKFCPFPCCAGKKLCDDNDCNICFEASFASSDKVDFWSELNEFTPREVFKSCNKKFWFNCSKSNHKFESALNNITSGSFCPFPCCGNQKLCDEDDCNICFEASFASSDKVDFWSELNEFTPREVFK